MKRSCANECFAYPQHLRRGPVNEAVMRNITKRSTNLAYSEGLEAHALSVKVRLEE